MKIGLYGITTLFCTSIYAGTMGDGLAQSKWIVGGSIGYGYLSTQEENILTEIADNSIPQALDQSHDLGNMIGGLYVGYSVPALSHFLAGLEIGYKYLGQSKYNSSYADILSSIYLVNNAKVNQQAVDFLLTAKLPIVNRISFVGKAGAAYVRSQTETSSDTNFFSDPSSFSSNTTIWRIKPEINIGMDYAINDTIDLNLMYNWIGGIDSNSNGYLRFYNAFADILPAVFEYNAITLGISYKID